MDREAASLDPYGTDEVLRRSWLPRRRTFLELMEHRNWWASHLLTDELVELGLIDDAIVRLRENFENRRLADVLADAGRWNEALDIVRALPDDWTGAWLAERFAAAGNVDRLRRLAATGVPEAASNLAAHTLVTDDRTDAEAVVSGLVKAGHPPTERLLAALVDRGDDKLAVTLATETALDFLLARVLVAKGKRAQAIRLLSDKVTEPDDPRHVVLADLMADEGRWSEALELAKGKPWAQEWIPKRLALAGNLDALRTLADTGLDHAGRELAALLAERDGHDELLDRTRRGDEHCAQRLVALAHDRKVPNSERLLTEGL